MIKVEALENFTLAKFDELKNIIRKNPNKNEKGKLYEGDVFECNKELADYLLGANALGRAVVKVIEIEPEIEGKIEFTDEPIEPKVEFKPKKNKKTSKK